MGVIVRDDIEAATARQQLCEAILQVARGDQLAISDVYQRTSAKLFGICLRICNDREAAEDVLQEVYVLIWRKAPQFDPSRASPITWLSTIARNRAIDWFRAQHPAGRVSLQEAGDIADEQPLADAVLEHAGEGVRLGHCLGQLAPRDQHLVKTAFFEGATYAELAVRSAQPLGTIKSRIRRALMNLRDCLGNG